MSTTRDVADSARNLKDEYGIPELNVPCPVSVPDNNMARSGSFASGAQFPWLTPNSAWPRGQCPPQATRSVCWPQGS